MLVTPAGLALAVMVPMMLLVVAIVIIMVEKGLVMMKEMMLVVTVDGMIAVVFVEVMMVGRDDCGI